MKFYHILLLCLLILIPSVNAGVAQLSWTETMSGAICVTAVDTNSAGTLVIAGLGNGSIIAYNVIINVSNSSATDSLAWIYNTNSTAPNRAIKKIVADANGNIAWISQANESGYISYTGAIGSKINGTGRNNTDVVIRSDGNMYAVSELNPPRITIRNPNGSVYAQNTTFGTSTYWTKIGYDPSNTWLISSNLSSNRLYYWNVSSWAGWEQFNPEHTAIKNSSQQFLDSFPYRQNISVNSATEKGIVFYNTSNVTHITRITDRVYFANFTTTGSGFYWTTPGNISVSQTTLMNLSWGDISGYYVTLKPGYTNYTMYYGNKPYTNNFLNQTWTNNGTLFLTNITSTGTWIAPSNVFAVNLTMYGGGGSGSHGSYPTATPGNGGSSAALTSYANVVVVPGTPYYVEIGNGGVWSPIEGSGGFTGGTSTFNGAQTATGGAGAAFGVGGAAGNGNISIVGYPTGQTGSSGDSPSGSPCSSPMFTTYGAAGGSGFGAGGGGGASTLGTGCGWRGNGMPGAPGVVQISYYINDIPVYYYGVDPSPSVLEVRQDEQVSASLNQTSSKDYTGSIVGISVPATGGLASIITDTIFYQQYISLSGFGSSSSATSGGSPFMVDGQANDVKASNSGSASIEARGAYGNIYDASAIAKAYTLTGGILRSVDSAMSSGLFAAYGGDEGKVYMLSREGSSTWYSYYTGTAGSPIDAVAVAWDGSSVSIGRVNGELMYYLTNVTVAPTPTPSYVDAQVRVYKDGAGYANQPVSIYSSTVTPYVWSPIGTSYTDGGGVLTYTTTAGVYYKFVVNNVVGTTSGEGEVIWQSNAASTVVQIFILSPSTPYEWNAYYTASSHNVTVVYLDTITPVSVVVTIKDLKTNLNVLTRIYSATPSFTLEYHDQLGNGTYQVSVIITRMGVSVRDQRIVTSPDTYGTILPNDQYITWGISTFILMLIAGMFSYTNSKRGALAVVVIAVVMMLFKLLPWSMVTVASLAAIFAVMSLFASRVQ